MSEQANWKSLHDHATFYPYTHPILSNSHPQISTSGIAMLSMLTMAIPDNRL